MRQTHRGGAVLLPLNQRPLIRTNSIDEARQMYSSTSTPIRIDASGRGPAELHINHADVGPVGLTTLWSRGGMTCTAQTGLAHYFVAFGRKGASDHVMGRGLTTVVTSRTGACSSPTMAPTVRIRPEHQGVQLRIDDVAMNAALASLLGVPGRERLTFDAAFSVDAAFGAGTLRFVEFLIDELERDSVTLRRPIVVTRWTEGLLFHMLFSQSNTYSERLHARVQAAEPRYLRRVRDYVAANALQPVTLGDLSALAGLSVRSIQAGFRRWYGCTPLEFLRAQRLDHARDRLLGRAGDPVSSVTQVALECGFGHLGRFSLDYRARFGESPKDTRRRATGV